MEEMIPELPAAVASLRELMARTDGRGLVVALPHMGNWDLAGSGCHLSGLPIFSVAGRQRNPMMNDLLNRLRIDGLMEEENQAMADAAHDPEALQRWRAAHELRRELTAALAAADMGQR